MSIAEQSQYESVDEGLLTDDAFADLLADLSEDFDCGERVV